MFITLRLLAQRISAHYTVRYNNEHWNNRPLKAPMIWGKGITIQKENCADCPCYVYITDALSFPTDIPKGSVIICAGDPGVKATDYDLLICEGVDAPTLFNYVQELCIHLMDWKDTLRHSAHHDVDMKKLLDMAREELDLTFVHLNRAYTPLASSDYAEGDKSLSELVSRLMLNNEANHSRPMDGPVLLRYEDLSLRCYVMNFHFNGSYRGKLLAFAPLSQPGGEWELPLLTILCRSIDQVYRLYSASTVRPASYQMMQCTLTNLLDDYATPISLERARQDSARALQDLHWNANDCYVLYYLPYGDNEQLANRAEYLVNLLENRWNMISPHSSRGIALGDGIYWVVNVSLPADITFNDFLPEFRLFLRELGANCGVSSVSSDFFDLHTNKMQAVLAVQLGVKAKPEENVHLFSDYSLEYIISNSTLTFPPETILHPCLYTLTQYDKENGTEFCKTLRVYMQCQYNVLQASSLLYVHRSTFSVRLKRIETLCGINLEDERTRLHILLSFYIMDANGMKYM